MTRTTCFISIGKNAIEIKEDATFSTTSLLSLGNLDDLKDDTTAIRPFATYEPDFWLLDGSYKFAPLSNIHGGYISGVMSGTGASDFSVPPKIEILFSELHTSSKFILNFSELTGDWSDSVTVKFYSGVTLLDNTTYNPTSASYTISLTVTDFDKIEIFFNSQNKVNRYARLSSIEFDEVVLFSGSEIKSATLTEQVSPLSSELSASVLEFTLFSSDGDFSIVNPAGLYANLQYKEPVVVREAINGDVFYIGKFYLDTWESQSQYVASFSASDAIGLLDKIPFYIGNVFSPLDSDELVSRLSAQSGIKIVMDASLNNINIDSTYTGVIPVWSCRDILKNLLFAIGGYATCARSRVINIKPFNLASDLTDYDHELTSADKAITSGVKLRKLVTSVEISSHDYESQFTHPLVPTGTIADLVEVFRGTVPTGTIRMVFDEPIAVFESGTVSRTTIENTPYYLYVNITVGGTYIVYRQISYVESKKIKIIENTSIPAGTLPNVIKISDAIFVRNYNLDTVAQRVYDYYLQRYIESTRLYGILVSPGDTVLVDTQSSMQIKGIIEKIKTNLTGGFVSDIEIVGVIA